MTTGSDAVDTYYSEIMMPTVNEFWKDRGDRRLAFLAAITVSHLADYIFEERTHLRGSLTDVTQYFKWLTTTSTQWGLIRDIGDASRHCRLRKRKFAVIKDQSSVRSQTSYLVTENGDRIITEAGDYIATEGEVYIRTPDGQEHEFRTILARSNETPGFHA
jgi:hypothetical protein